MTTMQRRHYALIADVINEALSACIDNDALELADCRRNERLHLVAFAQRMADALRTTNSHFDRHKFLTACGLKSNEEG